MRVPHVALVNLIAEERVVPELIQGEWRAERLGEVSRQMLAGGADLQLPALALVRRRLGPPGASKRAAEAVLESGRLLPMLRERYTEPHAVRSNKELFAYVQALKTRHLRGAPPLGKVSFDPRMRSVQNALGLHVTARIPHGNRVNTRREVRVAALFRDVPAAFLRMIVVHELAHMKHAEHDRDFYRLCCHMEPEYHQLELDLRLYLTALEHTGGDDPSGPN